MPKEPIAVVIPAHNEEQVLSRLLLELQDGLQTRDEVVVVCNGCTDSTAEIARSFGFVRVIELRVGNKSAALNAGDEAVTNFPRFYVDADIKVSGEALHAVGQELAQGFLAGAPSVVFDTSSSSLLVRAYYQAWMQSDYFSSGRIGSGIVGLSRSGRLRFSAFPDMIADDEFVRRQFIRPERLPESREFFTVYCPRDIRSLIRIKIRSRLGNVQLDDLGLFAEGTKSKAWISRARIPSNWLPLAVFSAVRAISYCGSQWYWRRGSVTEWARDESSRS